ncbi:hypothetical protein SFC43_08205 [Bacteroides sp. CR5/BHMF/2]|nr:hypothetical protein [Bacteroides sp. CR5/BHMF/2]
MLRYQINDSSRERVSLASDIRFLNDYLNLEKIRRDNFQFTLRQEEKWIPFGFSLYYSFLLWKMR